MKRRDERHETALVVEEHRLQRAANETLVLSALRAEEEAESALTARRHAEMEMLDARAREADLRETAEFRERLIGIIGHDLRNPLGAVMLTAETLIQRSDLSEQDERSINRILTSTRRMAGIIEQLVDFTRARLGGGFELQRAPMHLDEICRDVADEIRTRTSVEIRESSEGIVSGAWDGDKLGQALSNVVSNAVDHAAPASSVVIHTRGEGDAVVAEITNEGATIPPELLPVIFQAFRQADANSGKTGHLGLGLYIACEIVRSHRGTITVQSSDGSTTFTIRLPRR